MYECGMYEVYESQITRDIDQSPQRINLECDHTKYNITSGEQNELKYRSTLFAWLKVSILNTYEFSKLTGKMYIYTLSYSG